MTVEPQRVIRRGNDPRSRPEREPLVSRTQPGAPQTKKQVNGSHLGRKCVKHTRSKTAQNTPRSQARPPGSPTTHSRQCRDVSPPVEAIVEPTCQREMQYMAISILYSDASRCAEHRQEDRSSANRIASWESSPMKVPITSMPPFGDHESEWQLGIDGYELSRGRNNPGRAAHDHRGVFFPGPACHRGIHTRDLAIETMCMN